MQVTVKGAKMDIRLTVSEKRKLRDTAAFLQALARHSNGEEEKAAADSLEKIAAKWGDQEASDAN